MTNINITEVWNNILKFNEDYFPGWRNVEDVYYSNALAGEVGEICNSVKRRANGGTKTKIISDYELMTELADCFIYMQLIIEKHGYDLTAFAEIIQDKINVNKERMILQILPEERNP
jgi:NTP pyrophosphatase (non-canonical NTP hydrolase)